MSGAYTRNTGATVQYAVSGGNINYTGSGLANVSNILGGWATIGIDFASLDGSGNVVAGPQGGYTAANAALQSGAGTNLNITVNQSYTAANGTLLNTLRLPSGSPFSANRTLTITGTLKFSPNGGIYRYANSGTARTFTTTGGALTVSGGGEMNLWNNPGTITGSLPIASAIADDGANKVSVNTVGYVGDFTSGASTYSGGTYVNQGRLGANTINTLGTGPVYVFNGGQIATWQSQTNDIYIVGIGSTEGNGLGAIRMQNTNSGIVTLMGNARIGADSANARITGRITGSGQLEITASSANTHTLILANIGAANDWTGGTLIDSIAASRNITVKLAASEQIPDGASKGDLTLGGGGSVATFDLNGFKETVNGLVASDSTAIVQSSTGTGTLVVGNNNANSTFGGILQNGGGTLSLAKIGGGTFTLTGNNTYTGNTTISNGVLALSGSLANTAGIFVSSGATFDASPLGTFTLGNGQTLGGNGLVIGSVTTASGSIISPGFSAGTISFTNDLTLNTGNTCLFELSSTTNGANDKIIVAGNLNLDGATIQISAAGLQVGRYKLITYSGAESGTAAGNLTLNYIPSGGVIASLDDSVAGEIDLVVTPGVVPSLTWKGDNSANVWDVNTTANWTTNGIGSLFFTNGEFVTFNDSGSKSPAVNLAATVQPISLLVSNNTGTYTFSGGGNISGTVGLTKQGAGALVLNESGADDFSGGVLVGGGSLILSNTTMNISGGIGVANSTLIDGDNGAIAGNLASRNATIAITGGGTLNGNIFSTNSTVSVIGSGTINGSINNVGGSTTVSNSPNISGDVTVTGGTVLLDQTTTPSGNTIINSGTLQVGNNDENGNLPSGNVTDNGSLTFNRNDTGLTVANVISGSGTVANIGSGTVALSVNNSFSGGVTVNNGTLQASGSGGNTALGGGNTTVNSGGVLIGTGGDAFGYATHTAPTNIVINGGIVTDLGTSNYRITLPNLTLIGGTLTNDPGNAGDANGNYSLFGVGAPSIITTLSNNTTAVISAGKISLQQNNQATGTTTFNVVAGNVTGGATPEVDLFVSSVIANYSTEVGGVTKTGSGVMVLSGINTYTGATAISNGTLLVSGSLAGGSAVTVAAAGTLSGTGTVGGAVTVNGTIAPSSSSTIGTLTCSSTVTLNGTNAMKLNKTSQTNDVLSVGGNLSYGGTLNLTNLSGTLTTTDSFKLFNAAAFSGAFTQILPATPGPNLVWNTNNLTVNGTLSIVSSVKPTPRITGISLNGTTLNISATNGANGGQFVLLQSTNLALPLAQWTPTLTNTFDSNGNLNLSTNIVNPSNAKEFYILSQ